MGRRLQSDGFSPTGARMGGMNGWQVLDSQSNSMSLVHMKFHLSQRTQKAMHMCPHSRLHSTL